MRVLHVLSGIDPRVGGPVAALVGLAEAQVSLGLRVSVLATWCAHADLSLAQRLLRRKVDVRTIGPCNAWMSRHRDVPRVAETMVREADVVHIHAMWEDVQHQTALAAQRHGVPYVVRPCGMLDPWSFSHSRWKKQLYMAWRMRRNLNKASAIHFMTQREREVTRFHHIRAPAIVEPNGVDLEEFVSLPPRGTFRQKHPQIGQKPLIVFLGRIHPGKGVEHLIPAFARMKKSDAMLAVVGPDSDGFGREMAVLAERHGATDRVVFTGLLSGRDKVAALSDADVFALPSNHENFGVAVVEALAAGTPVVVSDQVYIHPDVTAAGVGAAVPIDVDALAAELDRWLTDDRLRQAAGARARPFVWEHYSWAKIAVRWAAHYEAIAARRAALPRQMDRRSLAR
jgi:glycosyltransferase involved in cell wall biosynthesis